MLERNSTFLPPHGKSKSYLSWKISFLFSLGWKSIISNGKRLPALIKLEWFLLYCRILSLLKQALNGKYPFSWRSGKEEIAKKNKALFIRKMILGRPNWAAADCVKYKRSSEMMHRIGSFNLSVSIRAKRWWNGASQLVLMAETSCTRSSVAVSASDKPSGMAWKLNLG